MRTNYPPANDTDDYTHVYSAPEATDLEREANQADIEPIITMDLRGLFRMVMIALVLIICAAILVQKGN